MINLNKTETFILKKMVQLSHLLNTRLINLNREEKIIFFSQKHLK